MLGFDVNSFRRIGMESRDWLGAVGVGLGDCSDLGFRRRRWGVSWYLLLVGI